MFLNLISFIIILNKYLNFRLVGNKFTHSLYIEDCKKVKKITISWIYIRCYALGETQFKWWNLETWTVLDLLIYLNYKIQIDHSMLKKEYPWREWSQMAGSYWWGRLAFRLTGKWSPSLVCIKGSPRPQDYAHPTAAFFIRSLILKKNPLIISIKIYKPTAVTEILTKGFDQPIT